MLNLAQVVPATGFWTSDIVLLVTGLGGIVAGGWPSSPSAGFGPAARSFAPAKSSPTPRRKRSASRRKRNSPRRRNSSGGRTRWRSERNTQRAELRETEKRLSKREDGLEHKLDLLNKKEHYIETLERSLALKRKEINAEQAELERLTEQEKITLHKLSELSREEAQQLLLRRLEDELQKECAELVARRISEAKENAEREARKILGIAIQRYAADQCVESVVAAVELPSDDMKGRIIGREGRNIRAFEKATGLDVVVDDTPGVVVISGFDGVRREMARRAMEKLVRDGRIHPARIEEVVEQTKKEMEQVIVETGKRPRSTWASTTCTRWRSNASAA